MGVGQQRVWRVRHISEPSHSSQGRPNKYTVCPALLRSLQAHDMSSHLIGKGVLWAWGADENGQLGDGTSLRTLRVPSLPTSARGRIQRDPHHGGRRKQQCHHHEKRASMDVGATTAPVNLGPA